MASPVASSSAPDKIPHAPISSTIPILIWTLVQIGGITLGAGRIPLWPHVPEAGEFLAVNSLLIVQILFSAILSPGLCQDWRTTVMAIGCAWPFVVLAGILAASSGLNTIRAGLYVTGWIAVLWSWNLPFLGKTSRFIVSAAASTWAAAGPILLFLATEYGTAPNHSKVATTILNYGPITSGMAVTQADFSVSWRGWALIAGSIFLGSGLFFLKTNPFRRFFGPIR